MLISSKPIMRTSIGTGTNDRPFIHGITGLIIFTQEHSH